MAAEFDLIQRHFANRQTPRADVLLGIGDDCALLSVAADKVLAISMDLLVAGVHFFADAAAQNVGHKALAVNLSDLAAQGAEPAWVTLGLALPEVDNAWLDGFCQGFFALADRYAVQLVGGDVTRTRAALTIAVQAHGLVAAKQSLRRDAAQPGDRIFVTGTLGDAALALALIEADKESEGEKEGVKPAVTDAHLAFLKNRLQRPTPRVAQGLDLAGVAKAAIDVSDGLAQDLGHILERSGVGARLFVERLPLSPALRAGLERAQAIAYALGGGDDYELCFTVAPQNLAALQASIERWDCPCSEIGFVEDEPGLRCQWQDGTAYHSTRSGYDHFG